MNDNQKPYLDSYRNQEITTTEHGDEYFDTIRLKANKRQQTRRVVRSGAGIGVTLLLALFVLNFTQNQGQNGTDYSFIAETDLSEMFTSYDLVYAEDALVDTIAAEYLSDDVEYYLMSNSVNIEFTDLLDDVYQFDNEQLDDFYEDLKRSQIIVDQVDYL